MSTVLLASALGGCATRTEVGGPPALKSQTVMGNYEAVAGCVVEAADKGNIGVPTLRVDRPKKTARVVRMIGTSNEVQYEITFAQIGAATVQVEGSSAAVATGGTRPLEFLWPQVGMCATNLTAP